jgi:general secretion pathway protein J
MQAKRKRSGMRGFTLAETLIGVAILGLIGVMSFGTFLAAVNSQERAAEIGDKYHQVRQAMLRMSREISQAFISEHRFCEEPRTKTIFKGERSGGGMRLDFTSFSHFRIGADANESDQNELSFYVADDPDDKSIRSLMRREQSRIDDEPEEGGLIQVLAENVKEVNFQFYDSKEDRWEDEWNTEDTDFKRRLPMFVRIELIIPNAGGEDETFVTKTRLFLKSSILIAGTGFSQCLD